MSRQSIEAIRQDARYALRVMRKSPAFTALAVVTLALGIGVNVASFAVAYGILIRPLPYRQPSRVVVLNLLFADGNDQGFSPRALRDWLPRLRTVDVAAAYCRREVTVRSGEHATVVPAALVTDRFFEVLGTPAEFGSARVGADTAEAVVGGRAASQILREAPLAAVGAVLSVSDRSRTINGIMPFDFAFPDDQTGLWLPSQVLKPDARPEGSGYSRIVARLKPGVTLAQVRDDADRVRLELNPKSSDTVTIAVLGESVVGGMGQLLMVVLAGSMLVLLVACANVATLFIGRDVARQRELAARMALGATAAQLVRGVGVETLLIAMMASLVGMAVGAATLEVFLKLASGTISGLHRVDVGLPVATATAVLTIAVTVLCGMVPAWHAARADVSPFLRANTTSSPRAWRVRFALVVAQIALSCVLLIGAGLLARTVSVLTQEDHGVQPRGVVEAKVVLSDTVLFRGSGRESFVTLLLERVRAMPGVQHAGFGTNLPPRPALVTMAVDFVSDDSKERRFMKVGSATPGYLRAMGAQFVGGRDFDAADAGSGAAVVILSESAARFYFAAEDPVGRTISRLPSVFGMTANPRVVGVVRDIKYRGTGFARDQCDLHPMGSPSLREWLPGCSNRRRSDATGRRHTAHGSSTRFHGACSGGAVAGRCNGPIDRESSSSRPAGGRLWSAGSRCGLCRPARHTDDARCRAAAGACDSLGARRISKATRAEDSGPWNGVDHRRPGRGSRSRQRRGAGLVHSLISCQPVRPDDVRRRRTRDWRGSDADDVPRGVSGAQHRSARGAEGRMSWRRDAFRGMSAEGSSVGL